MMPFLNLIVMAAILYWCVRVIVRDRELSWWWCVLWMIAVVAVKVGSQFLFGPHALGLPDVVAAIIGALLYLATLGVTLWHQGYGWGNVGKVLGVFLAVQFVPAVMYMIARST